jgi:hypothetical protein
MTESPLRPHVLRWFARTIFFLASGIAFGVVLPLLLAQPGILCGRVIQDQLKEISGTAASRRHAGILWVHNDGADARLFAVRTNGLLVAVFRLAAAVEDLEDIAAGPGPAAKDPCLYLGDIGDNDLRRKSIRVYCFPEPDLPQVGAAKPPILLTQFDSFVLRYPDGPRDAETLMFDPRAGDLIVATKQKRKARVYVAPAIRLRNGADIILVPCGEIAFAEASAGDISPDGSRILLRREDAAVLWTRKPDESLASTLGRAPRPAAVVGPPGESNGESVAWSPDGRGYYTLSEGKRPPIYCFPAF